MSLKVTTEMLIFWVFCNRSLGLKENGAGRKFSKLWVYRSRLYHSYTRRLSGLFNRLKKQIILFMCQCIQRRALIGDTFEIAELKFRSVFFFFFFFLGGGGGTGVAGEKSRSKDNNQQQTQPTYNEEFGNRTQATLVGGECSHHCAIPDTQTLRTTAK